MTPQRIIHLCLMAFFALAILYVREKWQTEAWQANPGYALISIILLAALAGIVFVVVFLPRMGDAFSTAMFSSGEEITEDAGMKAAARIASGDYENAILEFKKMLAEDPDNTYLISEIAKIYDDNMGEPDLATSFLQAQLEGREWTPDNAAFLMFRLVDVKLNQADYAAARDILEQVTSRFPDSRHAANSRHRLNEIEQLQFKAMQAGKLQTGKKSSAT